MTLLITQCQHIVTTPAHCAMWTGSTLLVLIWIGIWIPIQINSGHVNGGIDAMAEGMVDAINWSIHQGSWYHSILEVHVCFGPLIWLWRQLEKGAIGEISSSSSPVMRRCGRCSSKQRSGENSSTEHPLNFGPLFLLINTLPSSTL